MDVSELRRRILRALDEARSDAATKRGEVDAAQRAYDTFLETIAVPLLRQSQSILKAERQLFTVHSPAGGARLASDASPETFLELALEKTAAGPMVIGRVSRARGRQRVVVDERPIAEGKTVSLLTEEDFAAFLVAEIPRLVAR